MTLRHGIAVYGFLAPLLWILTPVTADAQVVEKTPDTGLVLKTPSGVPFDTPILMRGGKGLFRVPAGYLAAWAMPDMVDKNEPQNRLQDSISIVFWMPSGRMPEVRIDPSWPTPRPKEPSRPHAASHEYAMYAGSISLIDLEDRAFVSPERQYSNLKNTFSGINDWEIEMIGLIKYGLSKDTIGFDRYRSYLGSTLQAQIRCTSDQSAPPNPTCSGNFYSRNDGISFHMRFPKAVLGEWQAMADMVIRLTRHWRVSDV